MSGMVMPRKIQGYGWKRDLPDHRDHLYSAPVQLVQSLPRLVDLRPECPPIFDQLSIGSCTANALGAMDEFVMAKEKLHVFRPSRLFIYYNERAMEGTTDQDAGAMIRDGMQTLVQSGVCPETEWPYDISKFTVKPDAACYTNAKKHHAIQYSRVAQSLSQMKACLASGYPFVFGFTVYESFESQDVAQTGLMPMPGSNEQVLGGHAICCVGYDDSQQRFIIRNSWGTSWGLSGYFLMPYAYALDPNLASDFWTIRTTT